ncbi:MAG: galactokinase [Sphaerochaetaceae bacterium]|nr:galactokinase [Sphaerochaetaceae bacterium]
MKKKILEIFKSVYNYEADKTYFSPGRVNIIGGHTDYNGGHVLPFCIDAGIYAAVSIRKDRTVNVYSDNLSRKGVISFSLDNLSYKRERDFANYVSGVLMELTVRKFKIDCGFDIAIVGNLPRGGGLSSSAALLVLVTKIISDYHNLDLDGTRIALITKTVENLYIGVSCGIMDQFIIANGKADKAIYLNANTLDYQYVPVDTSEYKLLLVNSNQTRKLSESKYNVRQRETQDALKILKNYKNINYLCDLTCEDFEELKQHLTDDVLRKRVEHVVYEDKRVKAAKTVLENNDFISLGKLLDEAHTSARDLYEISSEVLDELVILAKECGSLGSRMIGGGFGGSTLNIIKTDNLDNFIKTFSSKYKSLYNKEPIINIFEPTNGVSEI